MATLARRGENEAMPRIMELRRRHKQAGSRDDYQLITLRPEQTQRGRQRQVQGPDEKFLGLGVRFRNSWGAFVQRQRKHR